MRTTSVCSGPPPCPPQERPFTTDSPQGNIHGILRQVEIEIGGGEGGGHCPDLRVTQLVRNRKRRVHASVLSNGTTP